MRSVGEPRRAAKSKVRRALGAAALALAFAALGSAASPAGAATLPASTPSCPPLPTQGIWHPAPTTAPWQWQLQGRIHKSVPACVFDVDGFETPAATVATLHRQGAAVVCYLDVGSWEEYRPDAAHFPRSVLGRHYEGFPEERWLDIAHFHRFAPILEQRFRRCAAKGFDAVEPDNVAGWENRTGFPLTAADQLRFNRWVARRVHALGMAIALKNDPRQVRPLLPSFDFAIVEQCFQYDECDSYEPFVTAGKAVFEAEYELEPGAYCDRAQALGFSAIRKSYNLFARPWEHC